MSEGAYAQFVIKNQTLESFVAAYQRVLLELGFNIEESKWTSDKLMHKAVLGDMSKALVVSHFVPAGKPPETGNRYGVEAEASKFGHDVLFRIFMLPYLSFVDRKDELQLSQDSFEMKLDDERCLSMLKHVINGMVYYGVEIYVLDKTLFPLPDQKTVPGPDNLATMIKD